MSIPEEESSEEEAKDSKTSAKSEKTEPKEKAADEPKSQEVESTEVSEPSRVEAPIAPAAPVKAAPEGGEDTASKPPEEPPADEPAKPKAAPVKAAPEGGEDTASKPPEEPPADKPAKPKAAPVEGPPKSEKPPVDKPAEKKDDKPAASEPKSKPPKKPEASDEEDEDFKYIVRIVNSDLDGHKTVEWGLTGISGIGSRLASIIADTSGIPRDKKLGKLTDEEIEKLEENVKKIPNIMPPWLTNRRKDIVTGEDNHVYGADIQLIWRDDINRLKMIRCYRGIRHEQGQKVRGQRTRANGRSGTTVGVVKKAVRQKAAGDKKK